MKKLLFLFITSICFLNTAEGEINCPCTKASTNEITRPGANEVIALQLSSPYRVVHGTVTASFTDPLENVLVEVFADGQSHTGENQGKRIAACLTNKTGQYCFNKLSKGRYKILFSLVGGWKHSEVYIKIDPSNKKASVKELDVPMQVGT